MNGQEKASENYRAFMAWISMQTDSTFREIVIQDRLNRGEICREIGFSRSVLIQNPLVKEALRQLEDRLRVSGVLPGRVLLDKAQPLPVRGQVQSITDRERLKKLEAENAGLRAELSELRQRLKRFETVEAVLSETGRLVR